ncbi:undecaprenyldiphospho-muramoylpentapeptide beta-N-acetylglucosaminyltransferase [Oceanispirochaeta sp.]|jgi:UDP-N-acetylglucosamine--N-acetylmuramyl-(pentapeptide) pyrophosphoryl-undecaprenol N-acetylglucosamine transferase|uniref:undecaprenyldiphospho-muramoylpentapeptide beta-N-acetylglucosaminyltransferase n=1 Tax=Oceanispirochaeta sp. TaxID=2035350 RepID=UPI0026350585|nr:undecaprenyldiphospho-muramoylpentapeptide beta-N-acetylglucosaminyltransferase [Oceanispirochaeta sp.]MDA3956951.1 undecaprenyldiphospho-muramoylpentapeptide beta-N-acetylglucosaminyltransferase [Oceanispirochaeta sp.]
MKSKTIVFTGGGTGGHVYPGLPIIKLLQDKGFRVCWIGSRNGIEKRIIGEWGLEYYPISTGKLRRYFSVQNFTDLFRIFIGFIQSLRLIIKLHPLLVFSKGGFVSVPPVCAAFFLRVPSYTHDSDVIPGLATKINHRMTRNTFLAYDESRKHLGDPKNKIVISGNPVRTEFFENNIPLSEYWEKRLEGHPLLLVLGGSSGAKQINQLIRESLEELCSRYVVVHQMGDDLFNTEIHHKNYYPLPYLREELPALLKKADLAVSRGGAGTLWELAVTETPGILIPLRAGSRGDQILNAEIVSQRGMALVLKDREPTATGLTDLVISLWSNETERKKMAENCRNFVNKRAEDVIVSYLLKEF